LACSGGAGTEPALPFKEQGAAASFFFGYFLFCGKKESDIHRLSIKALSTPNRALTKRMAIMNGSPLIAAVGYYFLEKK
jgi:hypothetical protein